MYIQKDSMNQDIQDSFNFAESQSLNTFQQRQQLPQKNLQQEYDFSFEISNEQIYQKLAIVSKKLGFELFPQNKTQFLAINQNPSRIWNYLFSCITFGSIKHGMWIVEFDLKKNQIKCCKTLIIKLIKGNPNIIGSFMANLDKQSSNILQKSVVLDAAEEAYNNQGAYQEENYESPAMPSYLETNAYYYFSKVLSQEQYSIGGDITIFVQNFNSNLDFKNSPNISLQSILQLVNKLVDIFFSEHNYGKKETKNIMSFCRLSVERFLFQKVQIHDLYRNKFLNQDEKFNQQQQIIGKKLSFQQQMKYLGVEQKFFLENQDKPYNAAIKNLESLQQMISPSEQLRCLQLTHTLMRSTILEYHKVLFFNQGKVEIQSMDEELPLIIFIGKFLKLVANTQCENIYSILQMVNDYINFYPQFDAENRLLTNFIVSTEYVQNEWEIK